MFRVYIRPHQNLLMQCGDFSMTLMSTKKIHYSLQDTSSKYQRFHTLELLYISMLLTTIGSMDKYPLTTHPFVAVFTAYRDMLAKYRIQVLHIDKEVR